MPAVDTIISLFKENIHLVITGVLIIHFLGFAVVYRMWQSVKNKPDFREKLQ
jgi:predicted negative regulator of RcsB-dependent stress response